MAYGSHMARIQTIVQLNSELLAALDQEAESNSTSRSAIIRQAIADHLAASRDARFDAALVHGYTTIPQGAADGWGSIQDQSRENTRRTLERLDAEENTAGLPW